MDILYWFESIRVPVLNEFMLLITKLGEETAFLVMALIMFWCVDKKRGYYIMSVGFLGTIASQFMKLLCRIPRPWVQDPNFTILEQAREAASGYSFPSGHSQSAVGTFGGIACTAKKNWARILCICIAVLVPVSRMYVGVHTPADVIVGALMSVVLIVVLEPVIIRHFKKAMPYVIGVMIASAVAYLLFVELYPFPTDVDAHNLQSGTSNAYTLLGCVIGMVLVYIVDEKWQKFSVKAVWWAQILKVVLGLVVVLIVKSGTKEVLNLVLGEGIGRCVRYFLVVVVAGLLWPASFKWFSKLGNKVQK